MQLKGKLLILSLIVFFLLSSNSYSQTFSISGLVKETNGNSMPGAGVALLSIPDSVIVTGTVTDTAGFFHVENISPAKYILKISFISYQDYFRTIEIQNGNLNLGTIAMKELSTNLKEVDVEGKVIAVQVKGDTTQFNADAYKVNKDATTEDLVTKMPGVTIQDGKVQAQGEDVKKVLIDGKPYLGDDPNAALKNLPAEAVEKIQVYDRKSDQSAFTGFDDGNTTKTMNIITRPQFRNGTFGKLYSGYGTDELWKNGFNINLFKDKRKLTILGSANNINEQNFSADDLLGVIGTSTGNRPPGSGGGGGGGRTYRPNNNRNVQQSELSPFLVDMKNGIATTYSAGMNYSNQWKKFSMTVSYFYNHTDNNSKSDLFRQYYTGSDNLNYSETSVGKYKNTNHRSNLSLEYKFDSLNSILAQPRLSFQQNDNYNLQDGINNGTDSQLSHAITEYRSSLKGYNFSSPILYRHSFLKKGRTFSANITPAYTQNKGETKLLSYTAYSSDTIASDSINQVADPFSESWNNTTELTYTEPLDSNAQLSFTYRNYFSNSNSDKTTYSYSPNDALFNDLDSSLSNKFENNYISHSFGTNYRYQVEKWNYMIGASYQEAELKNEQLFPNEGKLNKKFENILPTAMFQYKFTQKKNLRFFYRSSNNIPSINQLQNVLNNNNPLQLSIGNPDLEQDWQNNFNLRYFSSNTDKSTSFFVFTNATFTKDYIGNSTFIATTDSMNVDGIILANGSQLTKPVNLDGYYSLRSFMNYSFPVKKIKSNLSLNANGGYTRSPSLINEEINYSRSTTSGLGFSLSSNISDKFDFTLSSNGNYNNVVNSNEENLNNDSYNITSRFKIQVQPWKGLVLQTDWNHQYNWGLSSSFNQNYFIWNASIGYKFLKNRVAELRLSAVDLLNKNTNITRNTTDTYFEDVQYNQIQRYFMLTFTYNLKFFKVDK